MRHVARQSIVSRCASLAAMVVVVGGGVVGSLGCSAGNSLSGSISESHDLRFESVRLRLFTDQQAWELRYVLPLAGGGDDIVAKVVLDVPTDGWNVGDPIDLPTHGGRLERITARNDPFPEIERAELTFSRGAVDVDDDSAGSWGATFVNGKTVFGTFQVPLEHASFAADDTP